MYIKNLYASTIYKGVFVALCATALIINFGIPSGQMKWYILNYYTILSNVISLIFFTLAFGASVKALVNGKREFVYAPRAEGAVVLCIAITGLVYHLLLAPKNFTMAGDGFFSFTNMMLHYVGPLMVILDWLLFNPKGRFGKLDPLKWLGIPLAYFVYILVRSTFAGNIGNSGTKFPYAFIDPVAQGGWGKMFYGVAEIAIGMAALGYIIYLIDWALGKRSKRKTAL